MSKQIVSTEKAPGAVGPYSQGIVANGFVFTSGQLPMDPATKVMETEIKKATAQALENVSAVLQAAGSGLEKAVKVTVFLKDMADFKAMNEVYATYFNKDCPARSCFQVGDLPLSAIVEVEAIAMI